MEALDIAGGEELTNKCVIVVNEEKVNDNCVHDESKMNVVRTISRDEKPLSDNKPKNEKSSSGTIDKSKVKRWDSQKSACVRCGSVNHWANDRLCPARNVTCLRCKKVGPLCMCM